MAVCETVTISCGKVVLYKNFIFLFFSFKLNEGMAVSYDSELERVAVSSPDRVL